MSQSPKKFRNKGDDECKILDLESPYVVPLMMNCKRDSEHLISSKVTFGMQENSTFVIDIDKLPNREDVFCYDNGSWRSNVSPVKFYIHMNENDKVVCLTRCKKEDEADEADIPVRRRP